MLEREFAGVEAEEIFLDGLIEVLKSLPKPAVQIAAPKQIREMICAKELLEAAFGTGNVEVAFHSSGTSGSLRVECDLLAVFETSAFEQATQLGDNFEIYPLTNGKVRFAMMFYGLFRTVMYRE